MKKPTKIEKLMAVPTPVAGLALGIASLGWCWENLLSSNGLAQSIGAIIAGFLLLVLTPKILFNHSLLQKELAHPLIGSVLPTYAMAAMVVSNALGKISPWLANSLWLFALCLHLIFLGYFLYYRIKSFNLTDMLPSWFIPPVGIIVADVSFIANHALQPIAEIALIFGMLSYAIMLPMMIYRLIFRAEIPDAAKPTIAILAAPASLSLAGYLSISTNPSAIILALLFGIAILMTLFTYIALIKLTQLPFSPGFSAFTFPMVISATALFKLAEWMRSIDISTQYSDQIHLLALGELLIATGVVVYVVLQYLRHWNIMSIATNPVNKIA